MACPNDVQRSLPNGTQLRSFLPALPRPTVHSPEAVFTVESTEKTVSYNVFVHMKFFQFFLLAEANPQMHAEFSANAGGVAHLNVQKLQEQ